MRIVVRLFGVIPMLTFDVSTEGVVFEEEEVEEEPRIEGGSCHNFERDIDPIRPEDRYDWEWEDRKRGFGFR
jgi:hypothetical protein